MMQRTLFLILFLAFITPVGFAQTKQIPVVIIISDQLRYDAIGKFTPNINTLKADGISFKRAYCASPICVPSRASFFTGKYPGNNGSLINGWQKADMHYREVKAGIPNLYQVMAENWDSWHVGKQHFFTAEKIDKDPKSKTKWITLQTFKQWDRAHGVQPPGGTEFGAISPEVVDKKYTIAKRYSLPVYKKYQPGLPYFTDEFFANKAVDIIKNEKGTKPLLLNLMFVSPHPPYDIPEPYFDKFAESDFTLPGNVGKWYSGQSTLQLYNLTGFFGTRYSREDWQKIWPKYFGLVSLVDDEVGKVITALKQKGLYDKALIIFAADHGEMLGSHSLWQKMCMYEESARVPLIIKFPADFHPSLKETNQLVSLVDVWPTLIDYLHIQVKDTTDGVSLLSLIQGKTLDRQSIFIQYDGNGGYSHNQRCIVSGKYKLIIDTFKDEAFLELYNVITDPEEKENLITDPQYEKLAKDLIAQIRNHMKLSNDLLQLPGHLYENFLQHYLKNDNEESDE